MKGHLTRQQLGAAAFALAALLLVDPIIVVPLATASTDAVLAEPDGNGIDILALNPKNE